jgi:hypothetical protein
MFSRTADGLSSEHLFHERDFVVYCEGEASEDGSSTFDELFWTKVFSANGISSICKSLGSKANVKEMAKKIVNENLKNTIAAMDLDYDHLKKEIIRSNFVIYTRGYSFESDVISQFNFDHVLSIFINTTNPSEYLDQYDRFLKANENILKRLTAIDFKYINSPTPLFDRKKPQSIILCSNTSPPTINIKKILSNASKIRNFQTGPLLHDEYSNLSGVRNFYGKTVCKLVYLWFSYISKKIPTGRKISYDSFFACVISAMDVTNESHPRNQHYVNKLRAIRSN